MFWNGIEGLDTDLSRMYVVSRKVAGQVDYVLLSIKVAPVSKGMALHFDRR